jgi:hypothetical protein
MRGQTGRSPISNFLKVGNHFGQEARERPPTTMKADPSFPSFGRVGQPQLVLMDGWASPRVVA